MQYHCKFAMSKMPQICVMCVMTLTLKCKAMQSQGLKKCGHISQGKFPVQSVNPQEGPIKVPALSQTFQKGTDISQTFAKGRDFHCCFRQG